MQQNEQSSGAGLYRRGILAMAGGLGLVGMGTASASTSAGGQDVEWATEQVVGNKSWMYDTIQEAHDDLEEGGGRIYVTDGYNSSRETFPIVLTNYVRVTGASRDTVVDAGDADSPVFLISERDGRPYPRSMSIDRLRIEGGKHGVVIDPETHVYLGHLQIRDQAKNGVLTRESPDSQASGTSFLNYFQNVSVHYAGQNGIYLKTTKNVSHAAVLERCTAQRCGRNGAEISGTATVVRGGAYEKNGKCGIEAVDQSALSIRDIYFEGNETAQLYLRGQQALLPTSTFTDPIIGQRGSVIEGNYFNRQNAGKVGIHLEYTNNATIRGNVYNSFYEEDTGFLYIDDTCEDIDYNRAGNTGQGWSEGRKSNFLLADHGYRTRSGETIQPTDLSGVEGLYDGDRGIDDGTNTPGNNRDEYIWNESKEVWESGPHTIPFEGRDAESDAAITFGVDEWDGVTLHIERATVPDGGFVSVQDLYGNFLGHSEYLGPGEHTDILVTINEGGTPGIVEDRRHPTHWLAATVHRDTNGNEEFDWANDTPEQMDEPYLENGHRIWDGGKTTVVN